MTAALLVVAALAVPQPAFAHGIGVRGDLPLPLWMVTYGAGLILLLSFVTLGTLWPAARFADPPEGRLLPDVLGPVATVAIPAVRALALFTFATIWLAALAGPGSPIDNIAPYAVFVILWVGGLTVSGLVGDVWRVLSPFRTVAHLFGANHTPPSRSDTDTHPLARIGVWPAALLLFAFGWFELVHPNPADPRVLGLAIAVYVAVIVTGAGVFGRRWLDSAELFGVTFSILAAMAPLHRGQDGRVRLRPPLVGLARLDVQPGTTAVILLTLGTTTFDGLTRQAFWEELTGSRTGWALVPYATVGLLVTIAAVTLLYLWAMFEAHRRTGRSTRDLADAFAHSLVPIALAYAVAHYFSLVVFEGQRFLALASDPFQRGWDLFGTAAWQIDFTAVSTTTIAWVQAGAIVVGHVAGVVLAHDRAVELFDRNVVKVSQYPLLVAMVAYTMGGLALLLGG